MVTVIIHFSTLKTINFRYSMKSGDNSILDSYIDTKIREFMYNGGKGKVCTITELVKMRNKVLWF